MNVIKLCLLVVTVANVNQAYSASQIGKKSTSKSTTTGFSWSSKGQSIASPLSSAPASTYTPESHTASLAVAAPAPAAGLVSSPSDTHEILFGSPTTPPAAIPTLNLPARAKSPVVAVAATAESMATESANPIASPRARSNSFTEITTPTALAAATTKVFDVRTGRSGYNPGLAKSFGLSSCDFPTVLAAAQKGDEAFKALDPRQVERALGEAHQYINHPKFPATGVAEIITMVCTTGTEINRKYFGDAYGVLESDIKARLEAEHARLTEILGTIRKLKLAKLDCQAQAEIQGGTGSQSPISEYGSTDTADNFLVAADKIRAVAMPNEEIRTQTAEQRGSAFVRTAGGHLNLLPAQKTENSHK